MRLHEIGSYDTCAPLVSRLAEDENFAQTSVSCSSKCPREMEVDEFVVGREAGDEVLVVRQFNGMSFNAQSISERESGIHQSALESCMFLPNTQEHGDSLFSQPGFVFGGCHGSEAEEWKDGLGFAASFVSPFEGSIDGDEVVVVDAGEEVVRRVEGREGYVRHGVAVESGWGNDDSRWCGDTVGVDVRAMRVGDGGPIGGDVVVHCAGGVEWRGRVECGRE